MPRVHAPGSRSNRVGQLRLKSAILAEVSLHLHFDFHSTQVCRARRACAIRSPGLPPQSDRSPCREHFLRLPGNEWSQNTRHLIAARLDRRITFHGHCEGFTVKQRMLFLIERYSVQLAGNCVNELVNEMARPASRQKVKAATCANEDQGAGSGSRATHAHGGNHQRQDSARADQGAGKSGREDTFLASCCSGTFGIRKADPALRLRGTRLEQTRFRRRCLGGGNFWHP